MTPRYRRSVRRALRADLNQVVDVWVDAFSNDPFFRWIAPGDAAYAAFGPAWLSFIAALAFERGHMFLSDDAAITWIPPDLSLVGPDDIAHARGIVAANSSDARADEVLDVIMRARAHGSEEPHWILQYIGVRTAARGKGAGLDAVAPMLRVVDDDGLPCELISTNGRNVSFYERLGFVVTAEESSADGAFTMRPMRRDAR